MLRTYYKTAEDFIRKHRLQAFVDVLIFSIITYVFHKLWWNFYAWLESFNFIIGSADWLARQVYLSSLWFNKNILWLVVTTSEPNTMWFSNGSHVTIDEGCSGLKQFYQILMLFLLFPGPWKHKLWYIPFSFCNVSGQYIPHRVPLTLALWIPPQLGLCTRMGTKAFFYVIIFLFWVVLWVEKFRRRKKAEPVL